MSKAIQEEIARIEHTVRELTETVRASNEALLPVMGQMVAQRLGVTQARATAAVAYATEAVLKEPVSDPGEAVWSHIRFFLSRPVGQA